MYIHQGDTGRISFKSGYFTVDGKGHKIDGNFQSSLMYISFPTSMVTFKNITFMNSDGNAIEVYSGGTRVYFQDCNFINNTAYNGGAITSQYSLINIINCTFENNSAQNRGGAIYSYLDTWALYIESSNFTNNEANDGGAIYTTGFGGSFQVRNNSFINNKARDIAGAIHFTKNTQNGIANIQGSVFENNEALHDGGAVYIESSSQIQLNNNNFTSNSAYTSYGGAVYSSNPNTIPISNCTFNNNFAQSGGAIFGQKLNVDNCNFTNNSVDIEFINNLMGEYQAGGAIYAYDLSLNNSNLLNNSAKRGGAVVADTLTVNNSKFYDNSAYEAGGAIYSGYSSNIEGKSVRITNSVFKNNTAGLEGGAVLAIDLSVDDSEFYSNKVNSTGGAISTIHLGSFKNNEFSDNSAYNGNNLAFNDSSEKLSVDSTDIYQYISSVDFEFINYEESYKILLSNNFTVFFVKMSHLDQYFPYPDEMSFYETLINDLQQEYPGELVFLDVNPSLINYHMDHFWTAWELDGDSFFTAQDLIDNIDLLNFTQDRWNYMKLSKIREILKDDSFTIEGDIPDTLYLKANSTHYATFEFRLLQSQYNYLGMQKGVSYGYFPAWFASYKLSYTPRSELYNFTVEKRALNTTAKIGDTVSFEIIVNNTGKFDITGLFINEQIPDGLEYVSYTGDFTKIGDKFTYNSKLLTGEAVKLIINFKTIKVGNFTNVVIAGGDELDNKTDNDTVTVNETIENNTDNDTIIVNETIENNTETEEVIDDFSIPEPPEEVENTKEIHDTKVDKNATGNPIFAILLVLISFVSTLRRRRD